MNEEYTNKNNMNAQRLGQANQIGCEQVKQRQKEVPDALASLNQSISMLHEALADLYGTLSPVTSPSPQTAPAKEAVSGGCEMARRIYELTVSVKEMTRDVITVRNALEI